MRILGEWLRRWQYLIHRRQHEDDLQREMRIHREMMGEPRRFGNTLRLREESRDVWGWNWLDNLWKDLLYGLRQLRKAPAFTLLAVLTLAIGIGGLTTFSGLLKAALFSDLPVRDPGQLRQIEWSAGVVPGMSHWGTATFSYSVYRHVSANATGFSDMVCWSNPASVNLRAGSDLVRASVQFVSGNFFEAVGVGTAIGRPLSAEDDAANASPVAVLSYGAWQRLFGGEEEVIGRTVSVNGYPLAVIGVLTSEEFQPTPMGRWAADLTIPVSQHLLIMTKPESSIEATPCRIIGRIRSGTSDEQARQESQELVRQAFNENPPPIGNRARLGDSRAVYIGLRGLRGIDQAFTNGIETMLAFPAVIAALLAIVCSNIAGMMLARGAVRRGEVATRLALGASRKRVVRQLLTESLLLAGIGGAAGVGLCWIISSFIPWPFALDLPVLAITAGFSCITGLLFGLAPALKATRFDLSSAMKHASPGTHGSAFRSGNILVGVQVTLSLLLLVATGLQVRSLIQALAPPTFEPERVLTVQADPGTAGYTQERSNAYFEEAVRRLESLPGVTSATVSSGNGIFSGISGPGGRVRVISDYVAPRFFETMNIPVLLGRDLTWSDKKGAPLVVVVNEAFARTVHPGANPLGQTVRLRGGQAEIVGVVADSNNSVGDAFGMGQSVQPSIYIPFLQQQTVGFWGNMILSVRVNSDASALAAAVRRSVADIDANVIVDPARTQASQMSFQFRERQLVVAILTLAGLVALLEVAFGIYGTLSFFVGTRTSEIGLCIALGAQRLDVIRMVFRQSLIPVAIGILAGLIGAPVLARVLDSSGFLVVPIRASDELAIIGAALLLLGVALAAAFAPARRASRLAPMQALRHE